MCSLSFLDSMQLKACSIYFASSSAPAQTVNWSSSGVCSTHCTHIGRAESLSRRRPKEWHFWGASLNGISGARRAKSKGYQTIRKRLYSDHIRLETGQMN
jgi:hypothetical protein